MLGCVGVGVAVVKLRTIVGRESLTTLRAEIVTGTSDRTVAALRAIERHALPVGIVTDDGTGKTLGRLLLRLTAAPPLAVAPVRQTVILPRPPPRMTVCTLRLLRTGALTITDRVTLHAPAEAVTMTVVSVATGCVDAENVISVSPDGTVTDAGRVMADLDVVRVIFAPPTGAGADIRTRNLT